MRGGAVSAVQTCAGRASSVGAAFFGAAFARAGLGFFVAGSFAEALALEVVGVFVFFADVLARAFGMHARYTETPRARAFVRASSTRAR